MKKILSMALVTTLSIIVLAGCGNSSTAPESHDAKISEEALYVGTHDNELIILAIKKAADATGWDVTEFKSNEVIAEKSNGEETISTVIKIYEGYVEFENDDAYELKDAVDEEIRKEDKDLH